jgi:hypothetical protein
LALSRAVSGWLVRVLDCFENGAFAAAGGPYDTGAGCEVMATNSHKRRQSSWGSQLMAAALANGEL